LLSSFYCFLFLTGHCPFRTVKSSFHPEHHEWEGSLSPHTRSPHLPPESLREASRPRVPPPPPSPHAGMGISAAPPSPFFPLLPHFAAPAPSEMRGGAGRSREGLPRPPGEPSGQRGGGGAAPAGAGFQAGGGSSECGAGARGRRGAATTAVRVCVCVSRSRPRGGAGTGGGGCRSRLPRAGPHRARPRSPPANTPQSCRESCEPSLREPPGPSGPGDPHRRFPPARCGGILWQERGAGANG